MCFILSIGWDTAMATLRDTNSGSLMFAETDAMA